MAVYQFTLHSYRSWEPDNKRGFVIKHQGIQKPNSILAAEYAARANQPAVLFQRDHQAILIWTVHDACHRRNWRLHFIACEPSHVHILVSWEKFLPWQKVRGKLKNVMAWGLSIALNAEGTQWLSDEGSRKRVRDRRHFDHLMNVYLPRHRGLKWREVQAKPTLSAELLKKLAYRTSRSSSDDG